MTTLIEYAHTSAAGHDIAVSAEGDGNPFAAPVVLACGNRVFDAGGWVVDEWAFTPDGARDLAASLLLAADAADRGTAL